VLVKRLRNDTSLREISAEVQSHLAAIYDRAPAGFSVDASRFGLVTFNAAFAHWVQERHGIEPRPALALEDLLPLGGATNWRQLFGRALRQGSFATEQPLAGGRIVRLALERLESDGVPLGVSVLVHDAEAGPVQDARARIRMRLASLVESTRDLVWSVDPDEHRLLTYNSAFADHLQAEFHVRAAEGMSLEDMLPQEKAAHWHELFARALRAGAPVTEECVAVAQGKTMLVVLNPLKGGDAVLGIWAFARDITERKDTERALLEGDEERLRSLIEDSPVAIGVAHQLRIEYVNAAYAGVFRARRESLVGRPILEQWAPESRGEVAALIAEPPSGRGPLEYEGRGLRADGSVCHVHVSVGTLRAMPGHVIVFLTDISARKTVEAQLNETLEELRKLRDRLQQDNLALRQQITAHHGPTVILGQSPPIVKVIEQAKMVAPTDSVVLITGETGTGKELLARAVHGMSPRASRPMVTVNCAALPAGLIESELFGREQGAFTGASSRQKGRFELADGSTLFLDEVAELPFEVQAKLLRVLQDGRFERLGSAQTVSVNVRVIAATNHDLGAMVDGGRFRADLFYRLRVFPIEMPPLRARAQDIPLLVWDAVRFFSEKLGKPIHTIPWETMRQLQQHPWPGNVRELRNVIERSVILSRDGTLSVSFEPVEARGSIPITLAEAQRRHVLATLERTSWRVGGKDGAAAQLGVRRSTLNSIMKRLGIVRPKS
jgi:PAS domain S-box-containing protein